MKKKNWNFSVSLGLIAVTMLLLFSIITIQGTGAWFGKDYDMPNDEEIVAIVGDYKITFVDVGVLAPGKLLPGKNDDYMTITIKNDGDTDVYYWLEFVPPATTNLLWNGADVDVTVSDGIYTEVGNFEALNTVMTNLTYKSFRLNKGEQKTITINIELLETADLDYAGLELTVGVKLGTQQVEARGGSQE